MVVINKVLDRVFEQLTPMIRDHVAALGFDRDSRKTRQSNNACWTVLAEARQGKETK